VPKAKKPARGRRPLDPSGRQVPTTVRLAPAERGHLAARYGSVNAGLRELVKRDMAK
jgi:hypothetical protein